MTEDRRILHVDMDAFFAAVELLRRPELRGRPVVVGGRGDPSRRGVVSTASYEARRFGIHSALPLRTAFRLCPDAMFLPVDFPAYAAASRAVFEVLRRFSDRIEPVGLDEAYLDLGAGQSDPLRLGRRLKAAIREATGLIASVGIGPNKLLAKIASDLEKPDSLTRLTPEDVPGRVWPLSVRALHGVGPRTAERLAELDIDTVGALARTPRERLLAAFSPRHADALLQSAHGRDERPVSTERRRKSIGFERTFQTDCRSSARLAALTTEMLEELTGRLKERRLRAKTVTVKIRYRDFTTHTRSRSLPHASGDPALLAATARACLGQHRLHRAVRLLGVQLSGLTGESS